MRLTKPTKPSRRPSRRLHLLINAGPTREYFDSVRFISNSSSGKMGYAIATIAASKGHRVTLVSGPVSLKSPRGVKVIRVTSASEMADATEQAFETADAAILTAAVCDYRPRRQAARKCAKRHRPKSVVLVPTQDIAASLGRHKAARIVVAFAMEDHAARLHAERKLLRKQCDAIVLNGPENVGVDRARVQFLVRGSRWQRWPEGTKRQIAARLVLAVESLVFQAR